MPPASPPPIDVGWVPALLVRCARSTGPYPWQGRPGGGRASRPVLAPHDHAGYPPAGPQVLLGIFWLFLYAGYRCCLGGAQPKKKRYLTFDLPEDEEDEGGTQTL